MATTLQTTRLKAAAPRATVGTRRGNRLASFIRAIRETPRFDDQVETWQRSLERRPRRLDGEIL